MKLCPSRCTVGKLVYIHEDNPEFIDKPAENRGKRKFSEELLARIEARSMAFG